MASLRIVLYRWSNSGLVEASAEMSMVQRNSDLYRKKRLVWKEPSWVKECSLLVLPNPMRQRARAVGRSDFQAGIGSEGLVGENEIADGLVKSMCKKGGGETYQWVGLQRNCPLCRSSLHCIV